MINRLSGALILPHLAVTSAAIYRSSLSGFERYFSFLAALGANRGKLLQVRSRPATIPTSVCFPGLPAGKTALRLVSITFLCEEFLLRCGEGELLATINALDLLVGKTH
jgi:hypothetical protein